MTLLRHSARLRLHARIHDRHAVTSAPSVWVTVLAGGAGTRFWPLSTPRRPKQLLPLAGPDPLIADTLARVRGFVPAEKVRILAGPELVPQLRDATGLPRAAFMVEARPRGTGPVLARAAWEIEQADPGAVLVSLHSDHLVRPAHNFRDVLRAAVEIARRDRLLLTVAVPPDRPETGYGYIKPGSPLGAPERHRAYRVDGFVEKPDEETATRYVAEGYRWNSGIFVWPAATFLDEVVALAPEIARALPHLERGDDTAFYEDAETISVDEAVLERSRRVASIDATFHWDDIGGWEALARTRPADAEGNVCQGRSYLADAEDNIAVATSGQVVLLGVDGLLVVQTDRTTLVMPRAELPRLKQYLTQVPSDIIFPPNRGADPDPG